VSLSRVHPCLLALGELGDDEGGTLGDPASDLANAEIASSLQNAGLTQSNIQSAIQSYAGIPVDAQNAVLGLVSGPVPTSFSAFAPLLAAGLLASGVGAPVAAAVAAALPIIDAIDGIFQPKPQSCDWMVGNTCIHGSRPYGPSDPQWVTWDQYVAGTSLDPNEPDLQTRSRNGVLDAAFPFYRTTIGCELASIGNQPTAPVKQFFRAYYLAWQKNKEYEINGYQSANDYALLKAVRDAWNGTHAATSAIPIAGMTPPTLQGGPFCLYDATTQSNPPGIRYVNLLLAGDIDGQRYTPIAINVGAAAAPTGGAASSPSSSSSSSSAGPVVVGVAVAGLAGLGVWAGVTGRLASWLRF